MSNRALWAVSAVLAALFAAFQIQSSLHSGSLSLPVTYDDVGYFNDALARLDVLYRDGGRAFLAGLWTNPPHAPLQTLLTLAAFGLAGPQRWAAVLMNAVPLAIILRLFLGFACRTLPFMTAGIAAAALLAFPLLGLLILECRPDMLCALLTAAGALTIAADPRWREGDRRTLAISGALFVGALLSKPTLAPVTGVVLGAAALSAILLSQDRKRTARLALVTGGIAVLIVLPYYAAVFPRLYAYIADNAFGANAKVWRADLSPSGHALYYLTGNGGKAGIGTPWLAMGGALTVLALPVWIRTRAALCVVLVALIAYASVTVPGMKSPFLGLIVSAFLLGIVAIFVVCLLARLRRRIAVAAALALLAFSVVTWRPVFMRLRGFDVPAAQSQHFTRIYNQTADALASVPDLGNRTLYIPVIASYLNPDNMQFEMRQRGLQPPAIPLVYLNGDLSAHQALIAGSDVAILFSDDNTLPLPWPASSSIRKEIGAAVAAAGFVPVATVDGGPYLGQVVVLRK